jgi:hypothetical protein
LSAVSVQHVLCASKHPDIVRLVSCNWPETPKHNTVSRCQMAVVFRIAINMHAPLLTGRLCAHAPLCSLGSLEFQLRDAQDAGAARATELSAALEASRSETADARATAAAAAAAHAADVAAAGEEADRLRHKLDSFKESCATFKGLAERTQQV